MAVPQSSKHAVDFPCVRLDCVSSASKTCLDQLDRIEYSFESSTHRKGARLPMMMMLGKELLSGL